MEQDAEVRKKKSNSNRFLERSTKQMKLSEQVPPALCLQRGRIFSKNTEYCICWFDNQIFPEAHKRA